MRGAEHGREDLLGLRSPDAAVAAADLAHDDRGAKRVFGAPVGRVDRGVPEEGEEGRRFDPSWLLRSSATDAACLRRPSVVVVEPAQHREGHDAPAGLYAARPLPLVRDPLPDPLVRSPPVEVSHPFGEHAA